MKRLPRLVRKHLEQVLINCKGLTPDELVRIEPRLLTPGACFVTLTSQGRLRGCIGSLEAHRPLAADLLANAESAALRDPRFSPLTATELSQVEIEVSILTPPRQLDYSSPEELLARLRPRIDGVTISSGFNRATFLPQVWRQLPEPRQFLTHLCQKAGLDGNCWRGKIRVEIYTVDELMEHDCGE